uniref:ribosomal protein S2 n=1 Tax=Watanabea sichuanensis TaxID=2704660 RepID=UPI0024114F53|nr:ribosomal protein S2 [Watanabea sichuanensis]WDY13156.1 ribosomal protein S2 [Watanabea sichuanensis]
MVQKGVHLGHQTARWNPKMARYIYTKRNGVHIIDLIQTCSQLKNVSNKLEKYSSQGKSFLFVGTKRQASGLLQKVATECNSFYVNQRWLGGMLTNWKTIKRSLRTLQELEVQEGTQGFQKLPKKEATTLRKRKERLQKYLGGLKGMTDLPDVVIIVGQTEEMNAVLECKKLGITTVTILDTDCDPTLTNDFVAANDDSIKSLTLLCNTFLDAIQTGRHRLKESNQGASSRKGNTLYKDKGQLLKNVR